VSSRRLIPQTGELYDCTAASHQRKWEGPGWLAAFKVPSSRDSQAGSFFLLSPACSWLNRAQPYSQPIRAVPSFELAISQAIYHSKWLLGRFLGLMKGIEGQATETAA
jgi:hypothetical protein